MHADQLHPTAHQVALLVADQFPAWASLPLRIVPSAGTVNALFRIGDDLVARLPLRPDDPTTVQADLRREAERSAEFARSTTVPAPQPVALGRPGHGYPLPWSVQTWLPGTDAFTDDPSHSDAFALDLAALIAELRAVDTAGRRFAPSGHIRGGNLPDHDEWVEECLRASDHLLDVPALRRLWSEWRTLPRSGPDVMSHTDLHPGERPGPRRAARRRPRHRRIRSGRPGARPRRRLARAGRRPAAAFPRRPGLR